jgi:voltage-gated potassium channel
MKKKIHDILAVSVRKGDASYYFDLFIITLISLNVLAIVLESVPSLNARFFHVFDAFEVFSVAVFSVEYLLRLWTVTLEKNYSHPVMGRVRYALTPMGLIDLLAVLPFYLPFFGMDLRSLRALRMFRLFRLFKIARYVSALNMINATFRDKREELTISLIFTLIMLLITSTVMYHVENAAQPEAFVSIPQTMWWGIATLTTVGYGDVYPVTGLGKLLGGAIAIIGVGLFALPAGILASGFSDQLARRKKKEPCARCGHVHVEQTLEDA